MDYTPLNFLYIALTIFTIVVGSLISIILVKTIRILKVAEEIIGYYENIKQIISIYTQIPSVIKDRIKAFFIKNKNTSDEK